MATDFKYSYWREQGDDGVTDLYVVIPGVGIKVVRNVGDDGLPSIVAGLVSHYAHVHCTVHDVEELPGGPARIERHVALSPHAVFMDSLSRIAEMTSGVELLPDGVASVPAWGMLLSKSDDSPADMLVVKVTCWSQESTVRLAGSGLTVDNMVDVLHDLWLEAV